MPYSVLDAWNVVQLWRVPGAALDKAADQVRLLAPRNAKASLLRYKAAMLTSDFLKARDALHQHFDLSSTGPSC